MARPKKKPLYNSEIIMKQLMNEVVELYLDSGDNPSIRQIVNIPASVVLPQLSVSNS